ncbi:DUF473 domain-containing protein [Thermococcus sp.]|uniref:DUF473 domain-containing protein n=1 Tax=Thermococcus sp. TaxID=35749 RepID=UPI0025FF0CF1|nr:DUF473 domain-containing protein [Thermococcus sp.]
MRVVVLTGISRRALDELLRNPYRTLEIRSARNVEALRRTGEGDRLFLTYTTYADVTAGTEGLLTRLLNVESMEQRIPWEDSDEREVTVCRAQVRLIGLGRVAEIVERNGILLVRVREMLPHEMDIG